MLKGNLVLEVVPHFEQPSPGGTLSTIRQSTRQGSCTNVRKPCTGTGTGTQLVCASATYIFNRTKMADEQNGVQRSISKIKQWIGWSWTYLWGFWFLLVIFLLYVLRTPLRLKENLNLGKSLFIVNFRKH